MFNHNGFLSSAQQAHSQALLQQCASKPANAYLATDNAALNQAFANIALLVAAAPLHLIQ
jgi:hypothetical protein